MENGSTAAVNLPSPDRLEKWIEPVYYDSFCRGKLLEEWRNEKPFPHASLSNFLKPEVFEEIYRLYSTVEATNYYDTEEPDESLTHVYYSPVEDPHVVRFLYGPSFRKFLGMLANGVVRRPENGYPQIRYMPSDSYGFDIHTDEKAELDFVCILNLNRGWKPSCGGALCIWEKVEEEALRTHPQFSTVATKQSGEAGEVNYYRKCKEVSPAANTLNLIFFSPTSYHSVAPIKSGWKRVNLLTEWCLREGANARSATE